MLELADWRRYEATVALLAQATREAVDARAADAADGRTEEAEGKVAAATDLPLSPYRALFVSLGDEALRRRNAEAWVRPIVAVSRRVLSSEPQAQMQVNASETALGEGGPPVAAAAAAAPLRLAYLSRRFHDYAGTHLMLGLFSRHNRSRTHVGCFSAGPDDSGPERRLLQSVAYCDVFRQLEGTGAALAMRKAIRAAQRPQVLISYDGAHDVNTIPVLALQPAPVQMAFLGLASTSGLGGVVDYTIADPVVAPLEAAERVFSERLVVLPRSYQPQNPDQRLAEDRPPIHAAFEVCGRPARTEFADSPEPDATGMTPARGIETGLTRPGNVWTEALRALRVREGLLLPTAVSQAAAYVSQSTVVPSASDSIGLLPDLWWGLSSVRRRVLNAESGQLTWVDLLAPLASADAEEGEPATDAMGKDPMPEEDRSSNPAAGERNIDGEDSTSGDAAVETTATVEVESDEHPFVFSCFNRWEKLEPVSFDAWMHALSRRANSLLWLYGGAQDINATASDPPTPPPAHVTALLAEAAARGIHPSRIVFAARAPRPRHLHRSYAADLQLDTAALYGAHTTAVDGFFTGLPLVTLRGYGTDSAASFASKVGTSLVRAVGEYRDAGSGVTHEETDTEALSAAVDWKEYTDIAVRYSHSHSRTGITRALLLRRRLLSRLACACHRQGVSCSGLVDSDYSGSECGPNSASVYDSQRFASDLERASRGAYELRMMQPDKRAFHVLLSNRIFR
jgi:hypothetical protein